MTDMNGKVAMLTGAARGIGAAAAQSFVQRGASVVICDVLADDARATVEALKATGGKADFVLTDVSDPDSVKAAVEHTVSTFGRLDYALNNAGIFQAAPLAELEVEDWQRVVNVNLSGVFYCLKFQLQHMLEAGSGAIVNTASVWSYAACFGRTDSVRRHQARSRWTDEERRPRSRRKWCPDQRHRPGTDRDADDGRCPGGGDGKDHRTNLL
jgi:NAD(P)-dependent dehydrogenase (short-subunit alcohol dehydrogenase family)